MKDCQSLWSAISELIRRLTENNSFIKGRVMGRSQIKTQPINLLKKLVHASQSSTVLNYSFTGTAMLTFLRRVTYDVASLLHKTCCSIWRIWFNIDVVEYQSAIGTNIDVDFYFQQSPQQSYPVGTQINTDRKIKFI